MDITNTIYKKQDVLINFCKRFNCRLPSISSKEVGKDKKVLNIYQVECLRDDVLKELEKDQTDKDKANLIKDLECIDNVIKVYSEYSAATAKAFNNGYTVTIAELAYVLRLDEDYIVRNLKNYFKFFKINPFARQALKDLHLDYKVKWSSEFVNKDIFFNKNSVREFLLKHFKVTDRRIQINLDFDNKRYIKLIEKFKNINTLKSGIKSVIEDLEREFYEEKSKLRRDELPKLCLKKEEVNLIIQEHVKLQSLEDITSYLKFMAENRNKVKLQDKAIDKDENEHIKNYKYKSVNDAQVYYLLNNKVSATRYAFDNVQVYNASRGVTEEKIVVRYLINAEELLNTYLLDKDVNFLFSIDSYVLDKLAKIERKENEEDKEVILRYFFNRLMDSSF